MNAPINDGALISGYANQIDGTVNFGGTVMGFQNLITTGLDRGAVIGRENIVLNQSQAYHIGSYQNNATTPVTGNQIFLTAGPGASIGARFHGTGANYNFTDALVGASDIVLATTGKIQFASETAAEFYDARPICDEGTLPTTLANHLVSKAYADAYSAGTPANWATSAPVTIKDALDRLAAAYNAVHGAVP
ncbi:MAG TPA: hypothetical protein VLL52_22320 [Anaerolineae bacterium]|nr:hypothetical protein [Anaerolineae bacterium]